MCAVSGDDDRDDVGISLDGGVDDSGAVDSRQAEVRDDDVEREFCEPADRFLTGIRLCDLIPAVGELLGYGLPQGDLVLDEQQMFHRVSHLETANILTQPGPGPTAQVMLATHAVARPFNRYQPTEGNSWLNEKRFRS